MSTLLSAHQEQGQMIFADGCKLWHCIKNIFLHEETAIMLGLSKHITSVAFFLSSLDSVAIIAINWTWLEKLYFSAHQSLQEFIQMCLPYATKICSLKVSTYHLITVCAPSMTTTCSLCLYTSLHRRLCQLLWLSIASGVKKMSWNSPLATPSIMDTLVPHNAHRADKPLDESNRTCKDIRYVTASPLYIFAWFCLTLSQ